jgi:hypothetical protein
MMSRRTQVSVIVAATLAAMGCADDERDYAAMDRSDEARTEAGAEARTAARTDTGAAEEPMPAEVDNTGRNVRDRAEGAVTPMDQLNNPQDIELTQRIRSGITSDDAMSMQARNVKVISQNGVVTLRGPVETEAEKANIETLARNAGATQIDNQLEVAGRVENAPITPTTPAPAEGTREEY